MANKYKKLLLIIILLTALVIPVITQAADDCGSQFIPCNCLKGNAENCGLIEFVQLFANLYRFALKYLGALALLLFVIGGIMFMTSGGNQERVTRARHILVGTTIGLIIVMGSYLIVDQFQKLLGVESGYTLPGSKPSATQCEYIYGKSGGYCADTCPPDWTGYSGQCGNNEQMCCVPPASP